MAAEQMNDRNDRGLKTWAPLVGLGLCATWIIYLAATQIRDGGEALRASATGWLDSILLAPVKSLGVTGSYLLLLCLASLCFLVWTRRRVHQIPRRAIGLVLLLLALSALSGLVEGDGNLWGGFFGEILRSSFLVFGSKALAVLMSLTLLAFGLIMARDWFFFDDIRRAISGGRAAPAFAVGMGGSGTTSRERQDGIRDRRALQVGIEPTDDLERSLDFAPLPMASVLTTLQPTASEDGEFDLDADSTEPARPAFSASAPAETARADEVDSALNWAEGSTPEESFQEESSRPLTRGLPDRKKRPEIDAEIGSDDALEDFLAEERQEDETGDGDVGGALPELDWSRTIDERSDADLFADLDINELVATEVADPGKEPEMLAVTEAPVQEQPKLGWDEDADEVDWEDDNDDLSDDDEDDDEDDLDDDDDDEDDEDEDDDDEEDIEDDEEDDEFELDDDQDEDDDAYDRADDEIAAPRPLEVAASALAPAVLPSAVIEATPVLEVSTQELDELFAETREEVVEPLIIESAAVFPTLEVNEDELFELGLDAGETLDFTEEVEDEGVELEVQSLLFPEEDLTPISAPTSETRGRKARETSEAAAPRAESTNKSKSSMDEDWAPWGEDSAPIRPAAVLAAQSQMTNHPDEDPEDVEDDDFPELATEVTFAVAPEALVANDQPEDNMAHEVNEMIAVEAGILEETEVVSPFGAEFAQSESEPTATIESLEAVAGVIVAPKADIDDDEDYGGDEDDDFEVDDDIDDPEFDDDDEDEDDEDEDDDDYDDDDDEMGFGNVEIGVDTLEFEPVAINEDGFMVVETGSPRASRPQAGPGLEFDARFGDPLYDSAVELCLGADTCRISFLQRNLDIDFARAAALIERMEAEGLVGPYSASGHHETLVNLETWLASR